MDNLNLENPEYVDKLENVEKADIIKENVEKILEFCLLKENRTLRRENIDAYKQTCMREFTFMHQKYPTLFFSLIENPTTFPVYRLEEMLSLKKRIEAEELTTENASVRVGQQYYDEFVKDTVQELDKKIK
jgi:hypothetical protein